MSCSHRGLDTTSHCKPEFIDSQLILGILIFRTALKHKTFLVLSLIVKNASESKKPKPSTANGWGREAPAQAVSRNSRELTCPVSGLPSPPPLPSPTRAQPDTSAQYACPASARTVSWLRYARPADLLPGPPHTARAAKLRAVSQQRKNNVSSPISFKQMKMYRLLLIQKYVSIPKSIEISGVLSYTSRLVISNKLNVLNYLVSIS